MILDITVVQGDTIRVVVSICHLHRTVVCSNMGPFGNSRGGSFLLLFLIICHLLVVVLLVADVGASGAGGWYSIEWVSVRAFANAFDALFALSNSLSPTFGWTYPCQVEHLPMLFWRMARRRAKDIR